MVMTLASCGPARPLAAHVAVRWGTSVLVSRRVRSAELPLMLCEGAYLEGDPAGFALLIQGERAVVRRHDVVTRSVGDLEVAVDAGDVEPAVFGGPPRVSRFALSDSFSLALHALLVAVLAVYRAPLSDWADRSDDPRLLAESLPIRTEGEEGRDVESSDDTAGAVIDPRSAGAAGPADRDTPARGRPRPTPSGGEASPPLDREAALRDAATFGLVGLLSASPSGTLLADGASPWTGAGDGVGPSWGAAWGTSEGLGGLALSGAGLGAGGPAEGIPLGGLGLSGFGPGGGCDEGCQGIRALSMLGTPGFSGGYRPHPPRVRCPPAPEDCAAHTSGRLPPEAVQRVVRQNFGRLRHCYAAALVTQPSLSARVTTRFVIGRDGAVGSAASTGDGPPELAACVAKAFYAISFPAPEGGAVSVVYPISFSPE